MSRIAGVERWAAPRAAVQPFDLRARLKPVPRFLFVALLAIDAVAMMIYLIRVSVFDLVGHYEKFTNAIGIFVGLIVIAFDRSRGTLRAFNFTILGFLVYGLAMTLVRGHDVMDRPFWGQTYHWLIMAVGVNIGTRLRLDAIRVNELLPRIAFITVIASFVGYVVIERYRLDPTAAVYLGYPTPQLLLPLAFFLFTRRWGWVAACIALFFLGGKRGPLVAAVAMLILFLTWNGKYRIFRAAAAVSAVIGALWLFPLLVDQLGQVQLTASEADTPWGRVIYKWSYTFVGDSDVDVTRATSGRDIEIYAGMKWLERPDEWAFGQGFGWSINVGGDAQHYLHFAYLNYLITYGVIGAAVFFTVIFGTTARICWPAGIDTPTGRTARLRSVLGLTIAGQLVHTASASYIATSLLFWMIFGFALTLAFRPDANAEGSPQQPSQET